jgi:hypothetical protein
VPGHHSDMDPAVSKAITQAVGHEPPSIGKDYGRISDLLVRNTHALTGLDLCTSLEILTIVGSGRMGGKDLSSLESLCSLSVRDSGMNSLAGLTELSLLSCYLPRNLIHDIEPLMGIQRLQNLDLTGNPLSEESYHHLAPQLSERGCRVMISGEFKWNVTRHLHSNGVGVSCYRDRQGRYRLCRPGLALTDSPDWGHPVITECDVSSLIEGDPRRALEYFA